MRIRRLKRKRPQECPNAAKILFGVGLCLMVWSYFAEDEYSYFALAEYQRMIFSMSSPSDLPTGISPKLVLDFKLGPAVDKAKYFGFVNRQSNLGHNRSDWELLSTHICDTNEEQEAMMLSDMEIYQRMLPKAILLGVQKGGTTALSNYLFAHEDIQRTEKELYILDEAIDNYLFEAQQNGTTSATAAIPRKRGRDLYSQMTMGITHKVRRRQQNEQRLARLRDNTTETNSTVEATGAPTLQFGQRQRYKDALLAHRHARRRRKMEEGSGDKKTETTSRVPRPPIIPRQANIWDPDAKMERYIQRRKIAYESNPELRTKIVLDMTPNYMLHSDRVPARIECVVPWVKLFCILRDPIDRAISQYNMKLRVVNGTEINKDKNETDQLINEWGNPVPSLDEYILNDLEALFEVGVLKDWTKVDFESFWKSEECWQAWKKYIHLGLNAPIGMGLYALQLKPFLDMIERVHGPDKVNDYFLALDNSDLKSDPDGTYNRLLEFLKLQPNSLENYKTTINQSLGQDDAVSSSLKERVKAAIGPYNRKLGELLGREWGTKWL